jgi:Tol biopolymer transport system component
VRVGDKKVELVTTDAAGGGGEVLAGGGRNAAPFPYLFSNPSWSGDGTRVAFVGLATFEHEPTTYVYLVSADGSGLTKVPGTREALNPVLSPDGSMVAFARQQKTKMGPRGRAKGASLWLAPVGGGEPRLLIPWHDGVFAWPSSFSPDGSTLAMSIDGRKGSMAVALSLVGAGRRVLAHSAIDPVCSPDGSRFALLTIGRVRTLESGHGTTTFTPTELAVAHADGSALRHLTRTPLSVELYPSWDPSGERLAYTQVRVGGGEADLFGVGKPLMQINADGTCRRSILSIAGTMLFGATWQPGPGRETGPISC